MFSPPPCARKGEGISFRFPTISSAANPPSFVSSRSRARARNPSTPTSSARLVTVTPAAAHSASPPTDRKDWNGASCAAGRRRRAVTSCSVDERVARPLGQRKQADDRGVDLRRRGEGAGRELHHHARPPPPGRSPRGARSRSRPARRRSAGRPPSGTSASSPRGRQAPGEPVDQQGRADVVGQVGDDLRRGAAPAPWRRSKRPRRPPGHRRKRAPAGPRIPRPAPRASVRTARSFSTAMTRRPPPAARG